MIYLDNLLPNQVAGHPVSLRERLKCAWWVFTGRAGVFVTMRGTSRNQWLHEFCDHVGSQEYRIEVDAES